jgi:hypothetical protein
LGKNICCVARRHTSFGAGIWGVWLSLLNLYHEDPGVYIVTTSALQIMRRSRVYYLENIVEKL